MSMTYEQAEQLKEALDLLLPIAEDLSKEIKEYDHVKLELLEVAQLLSNQTKVTTEELKTYLVNDAIKQIKKELNEQSKEIVHHSTSIGNAAKSIKNAQITYKKSSNIKNIVIVVLAMLLGYMLGDFINKGFLWALFQ